MSDEVLTIPGLSEPVTILLDRWGIPHIRAGNLMDMFFAQGFNAARDRLWQMDLWRKRGLGLLAADFGPGYLEQDRAARLFVYRGDMTAEWACYSPDAQDICAAFVGGINAYIDLVARDPARLPVEFAELGTRPAKWQTEDVVRIRSHGWMRNALSEVTRANIMAKVGAETDLLRQNLNPPKVVTAPDGLDIGSIPMAVLDTFKLGLLPVSFDAARLAAPIEQAGDWRRITPLGDVVRESNGQGSNNWVIAGSKTESGRPILANDPHRAHAVPSLRYIVHLTCPEFDGIGAGEPVVPGIMAGHNGQIGFGLTLFFGPDQEDVYVYETHPEDCDLYRYQDGWERMRIVEETTAVRGAPDQPLRLKFTRHGPVIHEDQAAGRAYALRSVWFEPGSAAYFVSISSMRRKTFTDFAGDMQRWAVPAVNQVYADTAGNIGWVVAGFSPIRPNWDGLLPVPGDGRYEWQGFHRAGDLPFVLNPDKGFVATANEQNVPPDWSLPAEKIGHEWIESSRANRIAEAFAQTKVHSVATSCALQTDLISIPARRLSVLLSGVTGDDATLSAALALLQDWDGDLAPGSAAAALSEVWWSKHLRPGIFAVKVADPAVRALMGLGDVDAILTRLEQPEGFFPSPAARDALLTETLLNAYAECVERMGDDPASWAWGLIHHGYFQHALSDVTQTKSRNVGPLPMGGSESTPMNAMYRYGDFRVVLGASFRMVLDVGAWDNSRCINAPGQSGDVRSPHYGDLAEAWSKGEYVPLLFSQGAVDDATRTRITLRPAT
ncbi:penicillin acylase family protein [Acidisoma cellulosilytica]|uniref:Penicillin acylase family protein n=1 Tax=Acidisoma cellulosilyticum TaxID=2802395 RepID=A0A964E5N6_9PROT|nr:penicillin acylase family protein [Acidisoma cellulosilyticum]MCB8882721.1 penicillin acylase family protein [Acidisoma cellulosilyticum]